MVLDDKIKNERTGFVTKDYGFVSETARFVIVISVIKLQLHLEMGNYGF